MPYAAAPQRVTPRSHPDAGVPRSGLVIVCLVALAALAALPGCSNPQLRLVDEDSVETLAAMKRLTAAHPNHTRRVTTTEPGGEALRVAVHAVGDGTSGRTLVLIHGVFADHSTWRFVQGMLADGHDLLVIDLPGCGESDKPAPERGVHHYYTPEAVTRRVLQALRTTLAEDRREGPLAIVAHSYGGLVTLRALSDEAIREDYADVLDRVDRLVLFSPLDAEMHHPDPNFRKIAEASSLAVMVGIALGIVQDAIAEATIAGTPPPAPALRQEYEKRLEILRDSGSRKALQALIENALVWRRTRGKVRPDWEAMEAVTAGYARVDVPTLIVWGTRDESVPFSMGHKLASELPEATLVPIPGGMHSPHIECPRFAAELIAEFCRTGEGPEIPYAAEAGVASRDVRAAP